MKPLSSSRDEEWSQARVLLTDIDDTLTVKGRVPARVFAAMESLRAAGVLVIPVTGRPAGWCDLIARQWPVDAVVGENGALWFRMDPAKGHIRRHYADSADTRARNRTRLQAIAAEIGATVPGAFPAADQAYRETDLAIDICEDVKPLAPSDVERVLSIFSRHGATAKVSSIHVNGWFGTYDKLTMTRELLRDEFGLDTEACDAAAVFIGDSPNDAPMFRAFSRSVGVANLQDFRNSSPHLPRWITHAPRADGFVELAGRLLSARTLVR
ncbi:MAG: HAD-IIB family hydrolase [Pseudomonadota bacterium]|nr:HAD-IIB family hydrolase [Pseudomonadota bacterium]